MLRARGELRLDGVQMLPGVALFDHVESLLPVSGRGPLRAGGEPLPDAPPPDPSTLLWSGGVLDAISADRGGSADDNEPLAAAAAVLDVVRGNTSTAAVHAAAQRLGEIGGPQQVDRLVSAVTADRRLSRHRLATFARWLCTHGTRREVVKAGLALLGVSGAPGDRDLIIRLGLLEEMTLYSVVALRNLLTEPEDAIFDLAQQVHGWGRIRAVQRLNGTTNERICAWLLRGGAENGVMTEEIAFIAATTGGLRAALEGEVDEDLLDHGGELLRALAMGGPAQDMSDYPDGAAAMRAYVENIGGASPTLDRLQHLTGLERYLAGDGEPNPHLSAADRWDLRTRFRAVLDDSRWAEFVRRKLASDDLTEVKRAAGSSGRFGVNAEPFVRRWLGNNPYDAYLWQWLVYRADGARLQELLDLAAELLPLSKLAGGAADDLGLGIDYEPDGCLQCIVQRLGDAPGQGWPFLKTALNNRVTGVRNAALRALSAWPGETWPPDAQDALTTALWREPRDDVRRTIRGLLGNLGSDPAENVE